MSSLEKDKKDKKTTPVGQYSNMAFQLAASIGLCTFVGHWLDQHYQCSTPYCTIVGSLIGVLGGLYLAIKDFL